jgi:hypothetical protein
MLPTRSHPPIIGWSIFDNLKKREKRHMLGSCLFSNPASSAGPFWRLPKAMTLGWPAAMSGRCRNRLAGVLRKGSGGCRTGITAAAGDWWLRHQPIIAGIDPTELTNDVVLVPSINVVRANQTKCVEEPTDRLLVLWRPEDGVSDPLHTGRPGGEPNDLTGPVKRRGTTRIDRLTHHMDRLHGFDTVYDLDRVAVGFC